jgi:DNA-binding transcriptional regulator GbsR (MarR family)
MTIDISPAMRTVIDHVADLGPRWGLHRDTCAVHALLFLEGKPLSASDISTALMMGTEATQFAITDLVEWRMAQIGSDARLTTSDEPWDLLFAAMEERRRREIEPARLAFETALKGAHSDGTSRSVRNRIAGLHSLVCDLSALGSQVGRMSSRTLTNMTGFAGRALRALGRN